MPDIVISEKKLEDYIYEYLSCEKDGFGVSEHLSCHPDSLVIRQFNLGSYGIIDILVVDYCYDNYVNITIYELKKDSINKKAFMQLLRYKSGIIDTYHNKYDFKINKVACILIGGSISSEGSFSLIPRSVGVEMYTYDIDIDDGLSLIDCNGYGYNEQRETTQMVTLTSCLDYMVSDNMFSKKKTLKG